MKNMVEKVGNMHLLHPSLDPFFLESIESPPSDDGSPTCEWALVGVIRSNQMGSEARKAELEKIKQRQIGHGMTIVNHMMSFLQSTIFFRFPQPFLPSFNPLLSLLPSRSLFSVSLPSPSLPSFCPFSLERDFNCTVC